MFRSIRSLVAALAASKAGAAGPRQALAIVTAVLAVVWLWPLAAFAAPEAHILRIDPRAGMQNGSPLLTTVVETIQANSTSDLMLPCAQLRGNAALDCVSEQMEKPNAIWTAFQFPKDQARLLVKVAGADTLATLDGNVQRWGDSKEKGVGTAWLLAVDASAGMGSRYQEAKAIAHQFIQTMGPNDLMALQIFDDRGVIQNSKWKTFKQRNDLVGVLNAQAGTAASHGSSKPLFNILKGITTDAFGSLGNMQGPQEIPLHQAMVVLSNGAGREDTGSASQSATLFSQFVTKGRFPEDNTAAPKTPLPVISIWLPTASGLVNDALRNNDQQFMRELSNPQIGGFFDIVREGQGDAKGKTIINLVRQRFNSMYLVRWRVSCLNPTVEQTFDLEFQGGKTPIKGDASFKDVPIGADPSQWPLDIDLGHTKAEADANPVYPGGTLKVYGNFCWGGESKRAESYFIPAGTKPDPSFSSTDLAALQRAQKNLISQNLRGAAKDANDSFVVFDVPEEEKMLDGTGDNQVVRVLIYDNVARRASGHDEQTILTLKATKKPFNLLLILGIAGGVIVILLLVIVLLRGGGGKGAKKSRGTTPPAPVVAGGYGGPPPQGGGYGAPPGGGYGGPPPGGGYGGPPPQGGGYGGPPPQGGGYTPPQGPQGGGGYGASAQPPYAAAPAYAPPPQPQQGFGPAPAYAPPPQPQQGFAPPAGAPQAAGGVVQVRCPACQSMTMATPGQPSVCFSCGQPLPADLAGGGGGGNAPAFPLTGALSAQPLAPPPSPYGSGALSGPLGAGGPAAFSAGGPSTAAVLSGTAGQYTIRAGTEIRVGRDPAQCPVTLSEPRVSGVHSTLKLEGSQLWVRDETSNNGTYVAGSRIAPGTWVPVPAGSQLRFGPVEFTVRLNEGA
ncbi:FHA domain-containing protein [Pendulispora albinea]|uniref:FHA domain-containing protein n=1 Tax=Pendulispora albinea TaxID=2741071 RepID=A0ABZ2M5G5_9BACT